MRAWNLFNLWNRIDALLGTRLKIIKFHWSCWAPKFYSSKNTQNINLTWSIFIATSHAQLIYIYIYNFWDLINQSCVHLYLPLNSTRHKTNIAASVIVQLFYIQYGRQWWLRFDPKSNLFLVRSICFKSSIQSLSTESSIN